MASYITEDDLGNSVPNGSDRITILGGPTRPDPMIRKFISRSSDPISAIFFLLDSPRRPRQNKPKISYIGPVYREIIAKNYFLLSLHIHPN